MYFDCTEFYLKGDSKGYLHQATRIFTESLQNFDQFSPLTPSKFFYHMQNYLNKSWKLFEGKEIVQLEINFRNLISFIEAHLKTHKSLQNAESTQILMKSLDFLLQFLNKLIFYDFKMKLPMDSPLFRDEDLLNLLIFSDDWPLIFKYLTALYKLMNYNGWKLDTLDFLKQKRIFMIAYSFLSPNTAHFPHVFSLIEAHPIYKELYPDKAKIKDYQHNTTNYTIRFYHDVNKANIQINLQELLEEVKDYEQKNENNLILSDIGIEKDKTDMKNHDSNLEKNLIEDKPNDNLGVETQKMTKNTEKISNDKKILTCYEYARLLSQKFDIKETSLEFYELLFEIKLRNSFYNTETQFCFVIIGTLFGHMLFDLDFNQFIGQLNLISFECFSLKEIDRNQRFLYLLSLTQKNSDLLMTSLILLNEMKKPEYQIIEINNQNSNNLLLELKIMDEFKNTCELNQGNYEIMKLLLRFSLNFRIYLKSIRLKTFKFDLLKEVARLMESLDQFVLNLFKDFFKDEEIFPYKENIYLLEDFSAYNLVLQQEKPMIIHEIGSFKDVVSLKESDYVIYMMVRLFFSAFEYFKQIMNDRDTLVLKDIPLLDHLILTPVKYFGLRKQVFLVKIFINEGIFSELLVNFKKNNSNSIILKSYIHTLINNVLYYSLSQEPELKEFIYHSSNHEFLSILGWFQIFCQSNIVVFLCNFSLMRLYIEELAKTYNKSLETMISSLQNKTFCETYVEIVLKDLLLWGSSGIKLLDEIIVIRLLKPIFVIKFEEMLKELKNMIEGDLLELEQFFIIKEKQVISENFISFFVYLGYKYQKITINLNFILNTLFSETYFGSKIPRKLYNEYLHVFFQLALPFLGGIPKEALNSNQYHTIEETNHYPISIITNNLKHHLISSRSVLTDFQSLLTSNQTPIFYNMYSQYAEKLFQSLLNGKIHLKGIESFQTIRSVNIIEANLGLLKWMLQKYNKVEFYKENHLDVLEDLKVVYGEVLEWYDVFLDLIVNEYYVRLQGQWKDFEKANEQDFDRIWKFLKNHVANLTSITKALSEKNRLFRYITNLSKRIIKFSQIIKDLNKTSQDFTLQVLDLKLSLLKRKYLENKLENKGFLEVLKNLFWLDEIYRIFKHGHAYIKGELPWIIFNEDFLEKTIQIMSEIINPYITDHPQLNLEFFENKNHENPKFLELEFQFKYFICFFNEICCKFLIQKPYEELFHSLSENKELSQIENQKIFDRKLDKIVILNKEIMKFWKNLNRWNEDIPENMTNVYERVYKIVIQDNKIAPTFKEKIDKIGFKILELFLYSTYDNHIRIRSCYAFSIIHQLIINKINDDGLYLQEKKHFCSYFIHILSKHFQSIWQDWLLESSPLLLEISNKFNKPIEISYLPDINKLDHMTNCCTHAMILNLVSRLIQDGSTLDPKIEDGVSLMFNDWRSIYEYNRYVAEIFLKMKDRRLIDDEIKTLDYDTIENGISLLKKAIHTQNNISVNYEELLDICLLLLENYLSHHEAQMLFDPKREYAKLDKIKSFLELYLFALNHILTKDNKSLLFHNFSMRVLNKLKRIKYSNLQEKNKFQHSTHILLTRICDIFMFFDQSEFLSANLLIKLQAIFYDSERQTIKENIPLEVLCKDEEMNALFGAHYMIFLETFLSYCDISQNNTQNILVMIKPEAWGKKGKLILDGYQQEILDFFIDRTVESFENLTINIKSKESIEYDIIDSCYTMNMLAFFSGKYPLLIPLIAGKKIASKSVFFIDYLLDISARYYNIGKRLFLSFITINYSFDVIYKNNIGEYHKNDHSNNESNTNILKIPFITTSGFVWRKYFNEVLFQKIQKLFKDQTNFLKSPSNAISWKLCLELLNFLNSNISKENNNKENKEFQSKLNKFLWEIVETRENLDDFFILEQSNTFDILAHFYMTTIEDNFKKYTGITFEKKKHMKYLKENLNLFFQNFEQSPFDLSNLLQSTTESSIDQNENLQNPFLKQRKEEKIEIFNFNFNFNPFLLLSANENPNFISQENPNPFLLLSHEQNIEKPILSLKDSLKNTEFISEILKIKASSKVNAISINKLHLLYIESSNSSELERNWINLHNNWMNKGKSINQKLASLLTYLESRKTGSQKLNLVDSIEFFKTLNSSFEAFPPYLKNIGESLLFDLDSPLRSPANSQKNNDLYLTLMDLSVELLVKDDPSIQSPYDKDKNGNNNNIKEEEKTIIKLDEEENKEDEMLNFINNKEEHSNQIKQINHIFLDLGIPPDYMSLYKIDEALFTGFSLQEKIDYLLEKQSFFEEKSQLNSSNNFLFDFSDFNYPVNALELYEIDPAFFNGIPLEYKLEVLDQAKRDYEEKQKKLSKKLNEEKKIDYELIKQKFYIHRELKLMGFWKDHTEFEIKEFNEEINEDLNEIISLLQFYLDQNENKIANKILLLLPKNILEKFPENLRLMGLEAKSKVLEGGINEKSNEEKSDIDEFYNRFKQKSGSKNESFFKYFETDTKFDKSFLVEDSSKKTLPLLPELQNFIESEKFFLNLPLISDKILLNLLKALNCDDCDDEDIEGKKEYKENQGIFRLIKKLIMNPLNAYRILDIFLMVLPMDQNNEILKRIFEGKTKFLPNLKNKILAQIEVFLKKKYVLPLLLKENNISATGNSVFDNANEEKNEPVSKKNERMSLLQMLLELLKNPANEMCQDYIFKCLHALIEKQDEYSNESVENRKISIKRKLTPETLDIIISLLINKKLRFKEKNDQKNEIFQTLLSFCQDSHNFEIFSINTLEKLAVNINKELEIILNDLCAYKKQIGLDKVIGFDKKIDHENFINALCNEIFKKHEELYDLMYYFKKCIKDLRLLFENYCYRKTLKKSMRLLENLEINSIYLKKKWLHDINEQEKELQLKFFNKELNLNEQFLSFIQNFFEIIYFLIDFIGTDFKEDSSGVLSDCYNYFAFGVKGIMILQDFLTFNCDKGEEMVATPTLSRLNTKDYSLDKTIILSRKFSKQYEKINFQSLEESFKFLYFKMSPVIGQFMKEKSDNIGKIFVNYIKKSPGSLALSSEIKFSYLRWQSLRKAKKHCNLMDYEDNEILIRIKRDQIWQSTLEALLEIEPCELILRPIKINFENEMGSDFGGLTREWLALLNKEIFNPDYGLFQLAANKTSYQPSFFSFCVPDHLTHFRILGRLIGKTLIDNTNFEVHFVKSFLKHILKKTLYIEDLNDIDPDLEKNLQWVLRSPIDEFEFKFCYDSDWFGTLKTIELKENGKNELVTEENKKNYVKLLAYAKMGLEIQQQTEAFLLGFQEIIPSDALYLLDEKDLGLKLSGMPNIDIEEMKKFTEYIGYPRDHIIIKWFWEILEEFSEEMKANFLFFLSGSFNVPFGGFKNFALKIEKISHSKEALPVAHTCFNQFDIPQYDSKEIMKEKILIALMEGSKGFYIG